MYTYCVLSCMSVLLNASCEVKSWVQGCPENVHMECMVCSFSTDELTTIYPSNSFWQEAILKSIMLVVQLVWFATV